ncbi:MAG: hypothetical protein ABL908_12500, partial [Hyphomicrobium sp.]
MTTNTHTLDYEQTRCTVTDGALSLIDKSYARSDKLNIRSVHLLRASPDRGRSPTRWRRATRSRSGTTSRTACRTHLSALPIPAARKKRATIGARGPWGNKTFYYDGTGNRTTEITGSVTDTLGYPGGSNRVANVVTGTTTTRTFTHDGAGNITTDTRSGSAYTFTYNARGRLSTVSQDGNLKGSYQYNSLEQLASRTVSNSGP